MKLKIIKTGNSLGIRLPKAIILQCNFKENVIIKVTDQGLLLMPDPTESNHIGWEGAYKTTIKARSGKLKKQESPSVEATVLLPDTEKDVEW
ncbi:MAG: AbrB/MazE/SpoVT family DNA-binding domain-containing protein [Candidatus Dependentiae bacterium]|nr:AbrB/MazE/SpoVT family DNA-binding domain-containing protein [Candidatus Dependentiae bacterium]